MKMAKNEITIQLDQDQLNEIYAETRNMIDKEIENLNIKSRDQVDSFLDTQLVQVAGGYYIPTDNIDKILDFVCGVNSVFKECRRCKGTGELRISHAGAMGACHICRGTGVKL